MRRTFHKFRKRGTTASISDLGSASADLDARPDGRKLVADGEDYLRGSLYVSISDSEEQLLRIRLEELKAFVKSEDYVEMDIMPEFDIEGGIMTVSFHSNRLEAAATMEWQLSEVTEIDKEAALIVLREKYRRRECNPRLLFQNSPDVLRERAVQAELKLQENWWDFRERCDLLRGKLFGNLQYLSQRHQGGTPESMTPARSRKSVSDSKVDEGYPESDQETNGSDLGPASVSPAQTTLRTSLRSASVS